MTNKMTLTNRAEYLTKGTQLCWSCQQEMLVSDGYGNAHCDDCQVKVNTAARLEAYMAYTNQQREAGYGMDEFETERSL